MHHFYLQITRPIAMLTRHVVAVFRREGRALLIADAHYHVVAAVLIFPLAGLLIDQLVALSGEPALAGEDLLAALVSPRGGPLLLLALLIAATLRMLACATLMCIVLGADQGYRIAPLAALWFTMRRSWRLVYVTAKHAVASLPVLLPLLAAAYAIYLALLGRYDINFYLFQRPAEFWVALALGAALASVGLLLLLPVLRSWIDALPRSLFTARFTPRSRSSAAAQRSTVELMICLVAWSVGNFVFASACGTLVTWGGRELVQAAATQPWLIVPAASLTWVVFAVVNYLTAFLATASLATLLAERFMRLQTADQCLRHLGELRPPLGVHRARAWLWRRRWVLAAGALLVGVAVLYQQLTATAPQRFTQIVAHRGASLHFPENTLAAIQGAIDAGADWVEIDVQETADGVVVVIHDSDLQKVAGRPLKVWQTPAEQLRAVDIGSWFDPAFADQRLPTLEEALALCKGKIRMMIELKSYGHDQQLEQRVIDLVEAAGMERDVAVISLRIAALRKVHALRPQWTTGLLIPMAVGNSARIDANFLAVNAAQLRGSLVRAAHGRRKQVYVWTINDALQMSRLIDAGVNGVITDDPALMRELLRQRSEMTPLEKMLLRTATLLGIDPMPAPSDSEQLRPLRTSAAPAVPQRQ